MKIRKNTPFKLILTRIKKLLITIRKMLTPDPAGWKSAAIGIIILTSILLLIMAGLHVCKLGIIISGLLLVYLTILGVASALAFLVFFRLLKIIPDFYKWVLAGVLPILLFFWPAAPAGRIILVTATILIASLVAGTTGIFITKGLKRKRPRNTILNIIFLALGIGGLVIGSGWVLSQGREIKTPENAALKSYYRPDHINLPDPSQNGDYEVFKLCYGSGKDLHREEFGKNVSIVTGPVDGSPFVSNWDKFNGWARTKYWGFDEKTLPLNARVWYPGGEGPFPLVLIVHGNHLDREYSDPGYEYLGRLMAGRGFIFVSLDENFLNGTWSNMFRSLKEENDCRAWILLKHLEIWEKWNIDTINPFYKKVDLENIALIGHSRGGEAVAIAAAFNQLPYYPDDATVRFNFGYKIKSVIAIAPVDGQYKPARTGTFFNNVNYFSLQGSHDMDMQSYHGARQFQRIRFTDDDFHVKAGLYIWGANHGQFNSVWRRNDVGYPGIALYNRKQVMPEEDQEKIAKVYISAFLEATLNQKYGYLELFRDWRSGKDWLPETIYLNQYEDSDCKFVCTFEEDIDLETTTLKNRGISSSNLTVWKENLVPLKWGEQDTRGVFTGWNLKETDSLAGSYTVAIEPGNGLITDSTDYLVFSVSESKESSNPHQKDKNKGSGKKDNDQKDSLDFTVILKDYNNTSVQLPMSQYSYIQPQLEAKVMKADFLTKNAKSEIVFQTIFIPLAGFRELNEAFEPSGIREIKFIFDRTPEGVLVFDNIGFSHR